MYILKQGVLEIFKKDLLGDVRIAEIRPGGLVGEMALVDGKPRSANVKAAESARLLSLSRAAYNDLKRSHAQVATKFQDELLLLISSRLRQTTEKLVGK
jgi:CRP-like cAMP-binding protein